MMRKATCVFIFLFVIMLPLVAGATNAQYISGAYRAEVQYTKEGINPGYHWTFMPNSAQYDAALKYSNDNYTFVSIIPNAPSSLFNMYGSDGWTRDFNVKHSWVGSGAETTTTQINRYGIAWRNANLTYSGGSWYFTTALGSLRTHRRALRVTFGKYIPPGAPSSISYPSQVTPGQNITVSWSNVSTADSYRLQVRYRNSAGSWGGWSTVASGITTRSRNVSMPGGMGNYAVQFRVRAENIAGNSSYTSGSATTVYLQPNTPGMFISPQSDYLAAGRETVSWGQTTFWGNPTGTRNYRLQASYNGGSYSNLALTGTTRSYNYNIPDSSKNATIRFRVRAESGGGTSGWVYSRTYVIDIEPPAIQASPGSRDWDKTNVEVALSFSDKGSGLLRQRFAWTKSSSTPASGWSSWGTGSGRTAGQVGNGIWYLHVQAEDRVGNVSQKCFGPYKVNRISLDDIAVDDALFAEGLIENVPIYVKAGSVVCFHTRYTGDVEHTHAIIDGQVVELTAVEDNQYKGEFRVPIDAPVGTVYSVTVEAEAYGHSFTFSEPQFIIVVGNIWEDVRLRFVK
ncbi:MAG: hypothetical protein NUK65_04400 [Firmicutes bacterium]|nr:hypothetical protein [Bacillota bacterium]